MLLLPRRVLAVGLVLLISLGCSKKTDTPETPQKADSAEQATPRTERARLKARLAEALPPGSSHIFVYETEGDELLYDVGWARPGFPDNVAAFAVDKKGSTITVRGKGGEWVYESGKLKKETAKGDALAQQWDWMKKRVDEIADATTKVAQ